MPVIKARGIALPSLLHSRNFFVKRPIAGSRAWFGAFERRRRPAHRNGGYLACAMLLARLVWMNGLHATPMMHDPTPYRNVELEPGSEIGAFVLIGVPPRGVSNGELSTHIGASAVIRSHSVIYAGNTIGARFQAGH